jgi:probable HAF family extracellular repeat protein
MTRGPGQHRLGRLLWVASLACLGCGSCADDRAPLPSAPGAGEPPAGVAAGLRQRGCDEGMVLPGAFVPVTEVPSLGGSDVFVQDINDAGVAVGSERNGGGDWRAFRYTDAGGLQELGALPGFGRQSFASAIAEDGAIAGHADLGNGADALFGYRYTERAGHVQICPTVCSAWDLNAHGQVVGLITDGDDATRWQAFLFSREGGLVRLGTLGGARSSASGIDDAGVVVGNAQLAGGSPADIGHAFVWDAAHGMRDLNTVAAASGWELKAANDVRRAAVVGWGVRGGATRAFLYQGQAGRGVRDLGTPEGDGSSYGWALDGHGDVVGYAARPDGGNDAFIYSPNFGMHRLGERVDPAAHWDLQQANGINDRGDIVGWGYHEGAARGFKLTLPLCRGGGRD